MLKTTLLAAAAFLESPSAPLRRKRIAIMATATTMATITATAMATTMATITATAAATDMATVTEGGDIMGPAIGTIFMGIASRARIP